jgi:deoxyribodipyrimidine photo-lyase
MPRREVLGRPRSIAAQRSGLPAGVIPTLAELGLEQDIEEPMPGGEVAARKRLSRFLTSGVRDYADNHDALGLDKTSLLSSYLHFGCISPREAEERLPRGKGADAFRRQLCWRDFYRHVPRHFPDNAHDEFQQRYRGEIRWNDDDGSSGRGATGRPAIRSWTPGCVSCAARASCTTGLGSWWPRS